MGKFAKMLYMIDLLNTGNKYSLQELSKKIGVSERMIRYYKDELAQNGVFIDSFKGTNGGYFLIDKVHNYININKYDIQLLENVYEVIKKANFEFVEKYEELLNKIKDMNDIYEEKSKFIDGIDKKDINEVNNTLISSIKQNSKIKIIYLNIDGTYSKRTIHPLQFFKYKEELYITAYCELRRDIRHFECKRITLDKQ